MKKRFSFNTIALFTRDNKPIVDFYTKAFGFSTDWDGIQPNVEMTLDGMRLLLFPRKEFEKMISRPFSYPEDVNGTMEISLDVPSFSDVDREFRSAISFGAKPVLEPTTEPWGQRTCYIADPDGNLIEISSFTDETQPCDFSSDCGTAGSHIGSGQESSGRHRLPQFVHRRQSAEN